MLMLCACCLLLCTLKHTHTHISTDALTISPILHGGKSRPLQWVGITLPAERGCEGLLRDIGRPRFLARRGCSRGNGLVISGENILMDLSCYFNAMTIHMFLIPIVQMGLFPQFSSSVWNIHTITTEAGSRTNNVCEGWNNGFSKLVGHSHPTIWRATDCIGNDQAQVATLRLRDERHQMFQLQINMKKTCVLTVAVTFVHIIS